MESLPSSPQTPPPVPAALAVSHVVLRILVFLNWVYAGIVLAILVGLFAAARWTLTALGVPPTAESGPLMLLGMRLIAALGLVGVPMNFIVLSRLLAMVNTVRTGDPFVAQNAARLQAIAYAVLGQQLLQLVIGTIARTVSTPAHPLRISAFSTGGWLAVVLLFVLARVFAEGTRMRDELEGTV
jgi:hypothetical protein